MPETEEIKVQETPEITVISAKDWITKNLNIRCLTMPSGAVFKVKNVDLMTMVSKGYMPLDLVNSFSKMAQQTVLNQQETNTIGGIAEKDLIAMDKLCRKFASLAVIEPIISDTEPTSETVINSNDLGFDDVIFLFSECVKGGANRFSDFFRGRPSDTVVRPDGESISPETIGDNRNKGRKRNV